MIANEHYHDHALHRKLLGSLFSWRQIRRQLCYRLTAKQIPRGGGKVEVCCCYWGADKVMTLWIAVILRMKKCRLACVEMCHKCLHVFALNRETKKNSGLRL